MFPVAGSNGLLVAMLVVFLVVLPLILFFVAYYFRERLNTWWTKYGFKRDKYDFALQHIDSLIIVIKACIWRKDFLY